MDQQQSRYYIQRERAERAAAEAALCPAAKRAHEQLANLYAGLMQNPDGVLSQVPDGQGTPHLIILSRG